MQLLESPSDDSLESAFSSTDGEDSGEIFSVEEETRGQQKSLLDRIKNMYKPKEDGLTFRERLKKLGLSVLLSYGFVSNMSYCVSVSLAWFGFTKKTGLSPLAPGQWKPFLGVYAGFYVFNNIVRPIRLTVSVGVSQYFDTAVKKIQEKTKLSRGLSIGLVVFLANVCGTFGGMALGISIASALSGVPIFPPKV